MKLPALITACLVAVCASLTALAASRYWSHTTDEPGSVAVGMELLERGTYLYEAQHPPLGRVASAALLYFNGSRGLYQSDLLTDGYGILKGTSLEQYRFNLTLARAGEILFLIFASLIVYCWATELAGTTAGFTALILYLGVPSVLAHGSLANTDQALACTYLTLCYFWYRWLQNPSWQNTIFLGISGGLTLGSKMTALLFGVCLLAASVTFIQKRTPRISAQDMLKLACAALIGGLTLWSLYGFEVSPLIISKRADELLRHIPESGWGLVARDILATPLPLARYLTGIASAWRHGHEGHGSVFMGQQSNSGWWYFFPVVFLIKTPIPFLCAIGFSLITQLTKLWHRMIDRAVLFPLAIALAIFLAVMPSSVNIGIRLILPVYGLLAVWVAASLTPRLPQRTHRKFVTILALAQGWFLLAIFPNYLTYFNILPAISGNAGYRIACNSDFDWGQDGLKLGEYLRSHKVNHYFHAAVPWTPPGDDFLLPPHDPYRGENDTGYIAVSRCGTGTDGGLIPALSNLKERLPIAEIGETTLIYCTGVKCPIPSKEPDSSILRMADSVQP